MRPHSRWHGNRRRHGPPQPRTSASGRQSLAPSANPPPTPNVPKAPAEMTAGGVTRVCPRYGDSVPGAGGGGGFLTRVQPGEGTSGTDDVGGGTHKVTPVGYEEALGGQQRIQAVQQVQGVQVLRGGGRCLLPVGGRHPPHTHPRARKRWVGSSKEWGWGILQRMGMGAPPSQLEMGWDPPRTGNAHPPKLEMG